MSEIESSIEMPTELISEKTLDTPWISHAALSSAFFAVFAAIAALFSNDHSSEAMIDQIQASNQWNYYQAKGVKANLLATKIELLGSLNKKVTQVDQEKLATYRKEQDEIYTTAKAKEATSEKHMQTNTVLSRSVTLFQIAIGIAAVAVLSRKVRFWYLSLFFGAIALGFLSQGALLS